MTLLKLFLKLINIHYFKEKRLLIGECFCNLTTKQLAKLLCCLQQKETNMPRPLKCSSLFQIFPCVVQIVLTKVTLKGNQSDEDQRKWQ